MRLAATLVLARQCETGVEVFLSRRTSRAAFMANAWVYPGGRVDEADADPAFLPFIQPPPGGFVGQFEDDPAPDEAHIRAHYIALLREAFEEAGVLFADNADGSPLEFDDAFAARMSAHRTALNAGERTFLEILAAEGLVLDASDLTYFAHWITPPHETRRYDTRFFFATMPSTHEPVPDRGELMEGRWFSPTAALDAAAAGEIQLVPPTLCTIADLAQSESLEQAIAWARDAQPVPILPRMLQDDGVTYLVLPGDPLFPSDQPVKGATRVAFRDGRFVREGLG